jgi:hypothetical protein
MKDFAIAPEKHRPMAKERNVCGKKEPETRVDRIA